MMDSEDVMMYYYAGRSSMGDLEPVGGFYAWLDAEKSEAWTEGYDRAISDLGKV